MNFVIRRATVDDAPGIFEAHFRAINEICFNDYTAEERAGWMPTDRTIQHYIDRINRPNKSYLIVDVGGKVAGVAHFQDNHLNGLYFNPDYTGQGLAKALFQSVESIMKQSGYQRMTLSSTITAVGFYKKMGMKIIEKTHHRFKSGFEVEAFLMDKDIQ
jgi:putative acetyltransferase